MEYWNLVKLKPKVVHREIGSMPFSQPLPEDHNLGIVGKQFKYVQERDTEHEQVPENKLDLNVV